MKYQLSLLLFLLAGCAAIPGYDTELEIINECSDDLDRCNYQAILKNTGSVTTPEIDVWMLMFDCDENTLDEIILSFDPVLSGKHQKRRIRQSGKLPVIFQITASVYWTVENKTYSFCQ